MSALLDHDVVGEGAPLLFMHGLGADKRQTTGPLSQLTETSSTQLIAPSLWGHGDSITEDHSLFNFNQFADDCIALLDHYGIAKADVGGLSMGSGIAINIALRYPERVNKLIVLRPSWLDQKQPDHLKLVAFAGQYIQQSGTEQGEKQLIDHPDYQSLLAENVKVAQSINGVFPRPQAESAAAVLSAMWEDRPFASTEELRAITQETLILYTTRDELHPIAVAEAIQDAIPQSSIGELPPRYYENDAYTDALRVAVRTFLAH